MQQSLIKPLTIADRIFANNLIQGPLAGVSCAPFRLLTWEYSRPAFTYTEMTTCKTILRADTARFDRYTQKYPKEGPICFQLAGVEPKDLADAVQKVADYGADLIDLNCGCPVNKIRTRGFGSKLLMSPIQLYQAIKAMKDHTTLPVGIKIRVEGNSTEKFHESLLEVIHDAGCDFITVHGRHWREDYDTPCHYDQIAYFVSQLRIPVIGNGDVACQRTLHKMLSTGCAGAMISRAGVGQPWLIAKLIADINAKQFDLPSPNQIGMLLLRHARLLIDLLKNEKTAIFQMRKIGKYYARSLSSKSALIPQLQQCVTMTDLEKVITLFFGSHDDPVSSVV